MWSGLDLYYADGSHFSLTPGIRYAWQKKGEEILLPSSRSMALSVFGIMPGNCDLHAQMFEGMLNSDNIMGILMQSQQQ
jgi:hypothetical protein